MAPHLTELHEGHTDWWWRDTAERALHWWAESGQEFTCYDLTLLGVPDPDHPNRWGSLFAWAHAQGIVVPVGYQQSARPSRAGGVCRIWQGASR